MCCCTRKLLDCGDGCEPCDIDRSDIDLPCWRFVLAQPPNYRQQKKQREQAKKKKNDEKRQRKDKTPTSPTQERPV
jgi:hypothetical protein